MAMIEVIRRIYDEDGEYLEISKDSKMVQLRTDEHELSNGAFGDILLNFSPEMADQIGLCLIACAKECRDAKG